jgi:hypothetical protein
MIRGVVFGFHLEVSLSGHNVPKQRDHPNYAAPAIFESVNRRGNIEVLTGRAA